MVGMVGFKKGTREVQSGNTGQFAPSDIFLSVVVMAFREKGQRECSTQLGQWEITQSCAASSHTCSWVGRGLCPAQRHKFAVMLPDENRQGPAHATLQCCMRAHFGLLISHKCLRAGPLWSPADSSNVTCGPTLVSC
eukprot:1152549-Pelagomonas_calceolata.AAC.2